MSDKPDMQEWAQRLEWYWKLADHVSGESWRRHEYLNFHIGAVPLPVGMATDWVEITGMEFTHRKWPQHLPNGWQKQCRLIPDSDAVLMPRKMFNAARDEVMRQKAQICALTSREYLVIG